MWEIKAVEKVDGRMAYGVPSFKNPKPVEGEEGVGAGFIEWAESEGYAAIPTR